MKCSICSSWVDINKIVSRGDLAICTGCEPRTETAVHVPASSATSKAARLPPRASSVLTESTARPTPKLGSASTGTMTRTGSALVVSGALDIRRNRDASGPNCRHMPNIAPGSIPDEEAATVHHVCDTGRYERSLEAEIDVPTEVLQYTPRSGPMRPRSLDDALHRYAPTAIAVDKERPRP